MKNLQLLSRHCRQRGRSSHRSQQHARASRWSEYLAWREGKIDWFTSSEEAQPPSVGRSRAGKTHYCKCILPGPSQISTAIPYHPPLITEVKHSSPPEPRQLPPDSTQPEAMTPEESIQDVCIDKPRCRLCQFLVQDDEIVVAAVSSFVPLNLPCSDYSLLAVPATSSS